MHLSVYLSSYPSAYLLIIWSFYYLKHHPYLPFTCWSISTELTHRKNLAPSALPVGPLWGRCSRRLRDPQGQGRARWWHWWEVLEREWHLCCCQSAELSRGQVSTISCLPGRNAEAVIRILYSQSQGPVCALRGRSQAWPCSGVHHSLHHPVSGAGTHGCCHPALSLLGYPRC